MSLRTSKESLSQFIVILRAYKPHCTGGTQMTEELESSRALSSIQHYAALRRHPPAKLRRWLHKLIDNAAQYRAARPCILRTRYNATAALTEWDLSQLSSIVPRRSIYRTPSNRTALPPESSHGNFKMDSPHVLIIGAGVTGLLLGQALRKHGVSYTVYERDATHREQGWGLAFHWAFPTLQALMPDELAGELSQTYCIPKSTEDGEPGHFPFVDLETGEVKWALPPGKRRRVVRRKLCRLLETGLNVEVSYTLATLLKRELTC